MGRWNCTAKQTSCEAFSRKLRGGVHTHKLATEKLNEISLVHGCQLLVPGKSHILMVLSSPGETNCFACHGAYVRTRGLIVAGGWLPTNNVKLWAVVGKIQNFEFSNNVGVLGNQKFHQRLY